MALLEQVVHNAFKVVKEKCTAELALLQNDLQVPELPFKRLTYTQVLEDLKAKGTDIPWGEDISSEAFRVLGELYQGFYFVTDWPTHAKAFYIKPRSRQTRSQRRLRLNVELHRVNLRRHPHQRQKPTHRAPKRERPQPRQLQNAPTSLRLRHAPTRRLGNRTRTPNHDAHRHKEHPRSHPVPKRQSKTNTIRITW